ncbi:hypothetical protein BXZ70DRAFT_911736 [Cristinia sonorae]|uniref:Uncharacterized protein n=1 Tax=Cristinia sonorae TaxID=1940300 RepID=A0A8K0XJF6_9AGAR|nr:hypothetical protein BXZ70DRAFT_911736 [Cristinia sonorae]
MPFSFSKTSIIHPTHATTSAQSLGVRPDLNRLYTGRDYWEKKGHHDFSLWKVLSRKNSSSIRVEPEYNKKADGWKVSSVTGGKAGKPFGCLVPNSQVGILRLFIFRYHIARTIALNPLWKEFDENVQFAAKLEAEFYYAVMMAVKEEMRGAKKQKRNVPMHDVRLGALDEWMAFELFTKGDYFEYLQHPEIAVGAKGAVIEDLHEQLKGYITQKAKSIADENYLDSTRWTDPKQREMWYTALHDGGWSISRCKESNGWAGWTELPPLQQGTMDFGPFPSLEVEEWISSVEVPMKPDDGLGSSGNLENNGVSVEESAGEMCEEEGGAVKEGTATQRSVREGDDNLDDEGESMIVKAGYESYSDEIERRGIVNSDDNLFQHFTDPLREPVPAELLPTCISPQLLMLSHGGQQAGFMAQNIALSTGIANGEVPAARNEDIPQSGIPPAADSPGAPQPPAVLLPEDHGEVPVARNDDIPPSGIPPAADSPGAPQPPAVLLPEDHGEVPVARNDDIPRSGIPPTMTVGQGLLQNKTPAQQSISSHSMDTSSATLQSGNSAQATPPKMIPLKRSSSGVDAYPYTSGKKKWVLENPPDVLKAELDLVKLWEMRQKEQETMSVPAAKRGRNDTSLGMQGQGFAQSMSHPESKISMGNINDGPREESHVVEDSFAECESSFGTEKQLEEFHNKSSFREIFPRAPSATGRTDRSTYSSDIPEKDILTASPTQSDDTVSAVPPITHGKGLQFMVVSSKLRNDNMNDSGESEVSVNEEEPAKTGSKVMARGRAKKPRQGRIVAIRRKKNENEEEEEEDDSDSDQLSENWLKFVEMVNFLDLEEDFADVEGDDIVHDCSESWALPEMGVNVTDLEVPFTPEDGKDSSTTQQSKALTKSAKAARRSTRKTSKSEYSSLRAAVSNAQDKPTDDPTEQDVAVRGGDEFVEGDDIVHDCSESWALPEMGVNVTDLEVPFTPEDGKDSSTTQQSKALTKSAQAARRSTRKTSKSEYSSLRAAVSNAQDKPTDDPTEQDVAVRGGDEFVEGDGNSPQKIAAAGTDRTSFQTSYMTVLSLGHYQKWEENKNIPRASRSGTDGWVESGQSEQTPPSMETLTPQSQSGLHPELITAEQVHSWDAVWRRNQEEQSEWTEESEEELEVERIMSSPPPTEPDPDTTELESGVLSIQTAYDDWFTKWKGRLTRRQQERLMTAKASCCPQTLFVELSWISPGSLA